MERRVQGVVDVCDEREEARPVCNLAVLNRPYGALFRDAVLLPYNLVVAFGRWLGLVLYFAILLGWLLGWLVLPPSNLVRFEFAFLLSREHARSYADSSWGEGLRQPKLRQGGF